MAMISLRKPPGEVVRRFIARQANASFSYENVGATNGTPPAGFVVDHTRIELGCGESVYQAAQTALHRWDQFRLGWVDIGCPETPIKQGEVVAILGRALGLWWFNSCRIIYIVDEKGPIERFGFAYGTLPAHAEKGEERFLVEWNREEDRVWYDILAFSRPNCLLTRLGYPYMRRLQKRFARDSAAAMHRAVNNAN